VNDPQSAETKQNAPGTRRTTDPSEAEAIVTELFLPNRLRLPRRAASLNLELVPGHFGALTAGLLSYGREVRLHTADAENFHVNMTMRGRARSSQRHDQAVTTAEGQGRVFHPGAPADISWSADCVQLCLMVPRLDLETELQRMIGQSLRSPLRFQSALDLRGASGHVWQPVLRMLHDQLTNPSGLAAHPLAMRHLSALVLEGLLLAHTHNHSALLERHGAAGPASAIGRAAARLRDCPDEAWTTGRLAEEVHLSVRALQEGFKRDFDTPPMTYLRHVRLQRVREALDEATPEEATVHAVATRFGFVHMSRFTAAYREAFHETPALTLRRRN
jgi:AraC-like DNA-binding protein